MSDRHHGGLGGSNYRSGGGYQPDNQQRGRYGASQRHEGHQGTDPRELAGTHVNGYDYERRMDAKTRRSGESGHEYPNKRTMGSAGVNTSAHVYNQPHQQYDTTSYPFVHSSSQYSAQVPGNPHLSGSIPNSGSTQPWSHSLAPNDGAQYSSSMFYSYYPGYGTDYRLDEAATAKLASGEYYDPLAPPEPRKSTSTTPSIASARRGTATVSTLKTSGKNHSTSALSSSTAMRGGPTRELKENSSSKGTSINKAPGALVFSFESARQATPPKSTLFQTTYGSQEDTQHTVTQSRATFAANVASTGQGPKVHHSGTESSPIAHHSHNQYSPSTATTRQPRHGHSGSTKPANANLEQTSSKSLQPGLARPPTVPNDGPTRVEAGKVMGRPTYGERSLDTYRIEKEISEGAYGVVYKAVDLFNSEIVALKRVKVDPMKEKEAGFPLSSVREIRALGYLQHDHVVGFRDLVCDASGSTLYLVLDYVEHDLHQLLKRHTGAEPLFSVANVKSLVWQLLTSIAHLHSRDFMHRDIKSSNILVSGDGKLYLADFGLAKEFRKNGLRTPTVVTISYRAPELVFEAPDYNISIDMWSVGLIMAELLTGKEFFRGVKTEIELIGKLVETFGSPNEENYGPGYKKLAIADPKSSISIKPQPVNKLKSFFPSLSRQGFDLLSKMLCYNPDTRITASHALNHPWFKEFPNPAKPSINPSGDLPTQSPSPLTRIPDTSTSIPPSSAAPLATASIPLHTTQTSNSSSPSLPSVTSTTSSSQPRPHNTYTANKELYDPFQGRTDPLNQPTTNPSSYPHPPSETPHQYPHRHTHGSQHQYYERNRRYYPQNSSQAHPGSLHHPSDRPYPSRGPYPRNGSHRY